MDGVNADKTPPRTGREQTPLSTWRGAGGEVLNSRSGMEEDWGEGELSTPPRSRIAKHPRREPPKLIPKDIYLQAEFVSVV
jgi:hypothetical protein